MSNHPPKIPRLLVSVRSRAEASSAVAGGCDILDLKEPNRGSLGMVDLKIAEEVVDFTNDVPLSLALGELSDWKQNKSFPLIPPGITYCKIGLSGQAAHSRWQQKWKHFRESVDESGSREHGWIAVIYADYQNAGAPAPEEVLEAATNTNCAGVLIDTFSKTAGNVFECLPLQDLSRFIAQIRSSGMLVALAGSVSLNHLPTILPFVLTSLLYAVPYVEIFDGLPKSKWNTFNNSRKLSGRIRKMQRLRGHEFGSSTTHLPERKGPCVEIK